MWLYVPYHESPSVPASTDSGAASTSYCQDPPVPSCTVRGKPLSPKGWRHACAKGRFPLLQSGVTCGQSALQKSAITFAKRLAGDGWDCLKGAIPASHSAPPADDLATAILATYGPGLMRRLASINRRSAGSRMSQTTLFSDSERSDEISKREAISFRRVYSRRLKLALRTSDSGCSSSPWSTPRASDGEKGGPNMSFGAGGTPLPAQAFQWATPKAMTGGANCKRDQRPEAGGPDLQEQAQQWPTPRAQEDGCSVEATLKRKQKAREKHQAGDYGKGCGAPSMNSLNFAALNFRLGLPDPPTQTDGDTCSTDGPNSPPLWRTPSTSDTGTPVEKLATRDGEPPRIGERLYRTGKNGERINQTQSLEMQVRVIAGGKRKLSATFCEWLMGWPIGLTGSAPVEMESFLTARRQLFYSYLRRLCGSAP